MIIDGTAGATFPDASVQAKAAIAPSGEICWFAMNTAPTGFLKANGAAVSRTTYAALFAAIGTTFGIGDGSTTFNVPELRGEFIRNWDDSRGVDTGRTFGSAQAQDLQPHTHTVSGFQPTGSFTQTGASVVLAAGGSTVTTSTGTTETRPRNVALLACIRI
jgi:microcystin-dependent protein